MIRIITIERQYDVAERAAFIKKYFHAEWPNLPIYHVMINTATGEETVTQAILAFVHQGGSREVAAD